MNIETAKKLFQFLKGFNELKAKPRLDITSFEKAVWFYEIPDEKECYSITHNSDFLNANFDKWIEIKKPKRRSCPEPPKEIIRWLKDSTLNKCTEQPELCEYIISESSNQNSSEFSSEENKERILLEDNPEIIKKFENYLREKWLPWSQEQKRLESVVVVYNSLYKIYKKNKDQGEVYQVVLGLGFLSSKNTKNINIKRHIVVVPLSIKFNPVTGTITVGPCEQSAELSLEMDMFKDSEKPKISDNINIKLSELNNDFWKDDNFNNCLKSWLNSYDSNGQFFCELGKPNSSESFTTLSISPAIILRKRNERAFTKFYSEIIKDIENGTDLGPCLNNLINGHVIRHQEENHSMNNLKQHSINKKHYFPLPINEEQENIIKKISNNNQVVVQGPPGTGKTHSIANLICHFLAEGKKILITSQTDRALRVLRDKLPQKIQQLCIEILGKDQESLQELKNSFSAINSKYQNRSDNFSHSNDISFLEKRDDELKGKIAKIKNRLIDIKKFESRKYEKLFGFYTGSPADISTCIKNEEEKYKWIREHFNHSDECPISNDEAKYLLNSVKKLKDIKDSILEESIEFSNKIFSLQELEEKINVEAESKKIIKKYENYKDYEKLDNYKHVTDDGLKILQDNMVSICSRAESLLNRNEQWVRQALEECLADKDREWRHLYNETNKILDNNKRIFLSAERITKIVTPEYFREDLVISNILNDFFHKYKSDDKINWKIFPRRIIRDLKKIKIDGRNISSYDDVKKLETYLIARSCIQKINKLWKEYGIDTAKSVSRNFMKNYHNFKDYCEPLNECLIIHQYVEIIKRILLKYNAPHFQWTIGSIGKEIQTINFIQAQKTVKKIETEFKKAILALEPHKDQQNQIAENIISAYKNRNIKSYREALNKIEDLKARQKEFSKVCHITNKLQDKNFYFKLKEDVDNPIWNTNLCFFEEAWVWYRVDQWLRDKPACYTTSVAGWFGVISSD